jgi:CHAT domain
MTKILLLAANPTDIPLLQLDQEIRQIDAAIRHAQFADQFEFQPKVAVRLSDLLEYLEEIKPEIVHFSGHGSGANEIILEDEFGKSRPVSQEALKEIFALLKGNIRCVVLNACYAEPQANAIAEEIDCVVGMLGTLTDTAAIEFAREFYRQLANGKDVGTAFRLARTQIPDGQDLVRLHAFKAMSTLSFAAKPEPRGTTRLNYQIVGIAALLLLTLVSTSLWLRQWFAPPPMTPGSTTPNATGSSVVTADAIAAQWSGEAKTASGQIYTIQVEIRPSCQLGATCGTISVLQVPCYGEISLKAVQNDTYEFDVSNFDSRSSTTGCTPGAGEYFQLLPDGRLSYRADWGVQGVLDKAQ